MDYSNLPNPMKDVNADQKRTGRNFMANGFLDLKLPVKGLSFRSQFGYKMCIRDRQDSDQALRPSA